MHNRNKIGIIIPYFGVFPKWMSLFVETCKFNNFIDFHIFSDNEYDFIASNIIYHKLSFSDYCNIVSSCLSIDFHPQSPYKLCGIRPFYGIIHKDVLNQYVFWGFCDLDIILGNLKLYFSDANLSKYDIISTDWDRVSGPLCLIRNSDYYNNVGFRIPNWKEKLLSNSFIPLDEKYLSDVLSLELKIMRGISSKILRPIISVKLLDLSNRLMSIPVHWLLRRRKMLFCNLGCSPEPTTSKMDFIYKNHSIYDNETGRELLYLHFLFFKKNLYRKNFLWTESTALSTDEMNLTKPIIIDKDGIRSE